MDSLQEPIIELDDNEDDHDNGDEHDDASLDPFDPPAMDTGSRPWEGSPSNVTTTANTTTGTTNSLDAPNESLVDMEHNPSTGSSTSSTSSTSSNSSNSSTREPATPTSTPVPNTTSSKSNPDNPITTTTTTTTITDHEDIQVLSPQQAEREFRRKRRRQLYRLLKRPDKPPSFLAVLQAEPKPMDQDNTNNDDDDDEEDDDEIPSPMVIIDIDAYLGFQAKVTPPWVVSSSSSSSSVMIVPSGTLPPRRVRTGTAPLSLSPSATANATANAATTMTMTTPAEEGWYEGTRVLSMPEDAAFLGEMHQWVRQHLEFFSATELDVQQSQAGRRTKAVRGKLGIRCIHCARHILPQFKAGNNKTSWPPGAVTYPLNYAGLYSGASQKPQLHFEACPFLPQDSALARMLREARAHQQGNAPLTGMGKRKRMVQGISGLMYYVISCQRIGIQEMGEQGLRFTRDLNLEPLDFESIRNQVERERPDLIPRQYQSNPSLPVPSALLLLSSSSSSRTKASRLLLEGSRMPDRPTSSGGGGGGGASSVASNPSVVSSSNDAATQSVLQKALEQADDPNRRLIRRSDKNYLTDYMFLAISQMAICHASHQDFATRGKKTKLMRMGLAGFCCRHCQHTNSVYSCRSFSSAPDNLASAISNSFVLHLQKCPYTPREIQAALASAKRIHTRQMSQMPYGSQRKMFFELWDRMRAVDQPAPGTNGADEPAAAPPGIKTGANNGDDDSNVDMDISNHGQEDGSVTPTIVPPSVVPSTTMDVNRPNARGESFPISRDAETQKVLKAAESSWDPATNDHLIMPEDRFLVSDYVFLTMRQLKIAMPSPSDFKGNRRNNVISRMPGMCCIHCTNDPAFHAPSGRSFPSAPDNMASALNSSFYNHMQHCPHLDSSVKRALVNLRKIHSQQCSSLTFGSQRRFFNKVYNKLKNIPMTDEHLACFSGAGDPTARPSSGGSKRDDAFPVVDDQVFREHSFIAAGTVGIPYWHCLRCRMVPFEFRSIGAVHYVRPLLQHLKQHRKVCQQDGISLGWVNNSIREMLDQYKHDKLGEALEPLVEIVVGGDPDLVRLFMGCIAARGLDAAAPDPSQTRGWWRRLPDTIDWVKLETSFECLAKTFELSSSKMIDHPKILRTLEIMSPHLQVPPTDGDASEDALPTKEEPAGQAEEPQAVREQVSDVAHAGALGDSRGTDVSVDVSVASLPLSPTAPGGGDAPLLE